MSKFLMHNSVVEYLVNDKSQPDYNSYRIVKVDYVKDGIVFFQDGFSREMDDVDMILLNDNILKQMNFSFYEKSKTFINENLMLRKEEKYYSVIGYNNVIINTVDKLQFFYLAFNEKELNTPWN